MIKTRTMWRIYSTDNGYTPWTKDHDWIMKAFMTRISSHHLVKVEQGILVDAMASDATIDELYAFVPTITTIATNR